MEGIRRMCAFLPLRMLGGDGHLPILPVLPPKIILHFGETDKILNLKFFYLND